MTPRVLHLNHTGLISGAEHSLLSLLSGRIASGETPVLACPRGALSERAQALGAQTMEIPRIDLSFRLHPFHTLVGLKSLVAAGVAVRRNARRMRANVIHANSVRAGLIAVIARALGGPPVVTHIRDILPPSFPSRAVKVFLLIGSTSVVAISKFVAAGFILKGQPTALNVVDNPVDLHRFSPSSLLRSECRHELAISAEAPVLGVLAQLTPWKGQDDAIRTLSILREHLPEARLLIVGGALFLDRSTRFDNRIYEQELHALARNLHVRDAVDFLGHRDDPERILTALDLLLVPSHEEPFGRTIIEAMAVGVQVLATNVGGPAEIIRSGIDGMTLPPRHPRLWADACRTMLERPTDKRECSRRYVEERFSVERHVENMALIFARSMSS